MSDAPALCMEVDDAGGFTAVTRPRVRPGAGEVGIAVQTVGVCFGDVLVANRARRQHRPGVVPGMEVVGIVESVGDADGAVRVGQRVVAYGTSGGYASYVVRPARDAFALPETVANEQAIALPVNYVTALQALRAGGARQGQTIFFNAASGGVGTGIADLSRSLGLFAIGAASTSKHGALRAFGVEPLDLAAPSFEAELQRLTPRGIDLALDGLGLGWERRSLGMVNPRGTAVSYGIRSVGTAAFPFVRVLSNQLGFLAAGMLSRRSAKLCVLELSRRRHPRQYRRDLEDLIGRVAHGDLAPLIAHTFSLEDAGAAVRALGERKWSGKLALRVAS